jgi:hypothetical protein
MVVVVVVVVDFSIDSVRKLLNTPRTCIYTSVKERNSDSLGERCQKFGVLYVF